jgi:hypothetical protein
MGAGQSSRVRALWGPSWKNPGIIPRLISVKFILNRHRKHGDREYNPQKHQNWQNLNPHKFQQDKNPPNSDWNER